jgi:hypothetical protein
MSVARKLVDGRYRRVVSLSQQYPYWGYRKIYDLLRDQGISRERVRLIRHREGLQDSHPALSVLAGKNCFKANHSGYFLHSDERKRTS